MTTGETRREALAARLLRTRCSAAAGRSARSRVGDNECRRCDVGRGGKQRKPARILNEGKRSCRGGDEVSHETRETGSIGDEMSPPESKGVIDTRGANRLLDEA